MFFKNIRKIINDNKSFFLPYLTLLIVSSLPLLLVEKDSIHIAINQKNHPAADVFFKYLTFLGDGRMVGIYAIILVFIKYRYALIMLLSNLLAGIATTFLKLQVFDDALRPKRYFKDIYELRLVPDVDIFSNNSFPSGHTATAFCVFACFALVSKKKSLGFVFLLVAALIGFSRIYLSQHFLVDVYFGSLLGVFFALVVYYIFELKVKSPRLEKALFKK